MGETAASVAFKLAERCAVPVVEKLSGKLISKHTIFLRHSGRCDVAKDIVILKGFVNHVPLVDIGSCSGNDICKHSLYIALTSCLLQYSTIDVGVDRSTELSRAHVLIP